MARNRINTYMALLLTLSLSAGAALSPGEALARTASDVTVVNTVVQAQPGALRSDWLLNSGNQTIILGALESDDLVTAEFTLEAARDITSQLIWYPTQAAPVWTEVEFELREGEGTLTEDHILKLSEGAKAVVRLTIYTEQEISVAQTVDIRMICEDLLGTFRVELIPDPPETEPTEPEETEPTEPEETEPSQPEETEPTEPEVTEPSQPEETEPEESTEPSQPGGTVDPIDPIAPSEPEHTTHGQRPGYGITTTDPEVPAEPEETIPEEEPDATEPEPEAVVELRTLDEFEVTRYLPVKVPVSGDADSLRLGLSGEEPLPAFTRYSLDGGQNWYLLYFGGWIEQTLDPAEEEGEQALILLLDFSNAELTEGESICLEARAYLGEQLTAVASRETIPRETQIRQESVRILIAPDENAQTQLVQMLLTAAEYAEPTEPSEAIEPSEPSEPSDPSESTEPSEQQETEPSESPESTEPEESSQPAESEPEETVPENSLPPEPDTPTEPSQPEETEPTEPEPPAEPEIPEPPLTEGYYFRVALPLGWEACEEIRYRAELLTINADGKPEYTEVPWNPESLDAVIDPSTGTLIVYMGARTPQAGTYRLTLECIYERICFEQTQMTFFINYSTRSDAQNEEVPNND